MEPAKPVHLHGLAADGEGTSPHQRRRVVPAHARQREYGIEAARPSELHQLTNFPARDGKFISGGAQPHRTWLEKLVWRMVCAGHHPVTAQPYVAVRTPPRIY